MRYNVQSVLEREHRGEILEYVCFWMPTEGSKEVDKGCLSQWYLIDFEVEGIVYSSTEQYMMAAKARYFEDEETLCRIMAATHPEMIKKLGRQVRHFDSKAWARVAPEVVIEGNLHKFGQHAALLHYLCSTENKVLVEASPYDCIWGVGWAETDVNATCPACWQGRNQMGFVLMEVRDRLMQCK